MSPDDLDSYSNDDNYEPITDNDEIEDNAGEDE